MVNSFFIPNKFLYEKIPTKFLDFTEYDGTYTVKRGIEVSNFDWSPFFLLSVHKISHCW